MVSQRKGSQKPSNKIPAKKRERPLIVKRNASNSEPNYFKYKKDLFDKTGNMWIPNDETKKRYFNDIYGSLSPGRVRYLLDGTKYGRWHISYERLTRRPHLTLEAPRGNEHPDFETTHPIGRLLSRFARDRHRITNVYKEENRKEAAEAAQRIADTRARRLGGRRSAASRANASISQISRENIQTNRLGRRFNNVSMLENENKRRERLKGVNRLLANKEFKEFLEKERVHFDKKTQPRKSNLGIKKQAQYRIKKIENKKKYKEDVAEWVRKIKPSTSKSAPKGRASRKAIRKKTKLSRSPRRSSDKKMSQKKRGTQKMKSSVKSRSKKQGKSASPRTQNAIAKLINNNMKALKVGTSRRSPRSFLRSKL